MKKKEKKDNGYTLVSAENLQKEDGIRCQGMTPSVNPRKEKVKDYKSVALKFKDKTEAIALAVEILRVANTKEMENEKSTLNITAYKEDKFKNDKGYHTTVTLYGPK